MSNHTPGPWTRFPGERFKHDSSAGVKDSSGNYIACALDQNRYDRDEEVEANARLIASAPELLAACEALAAFTRDLLKLVTPEQIKEARLTTRMLKLNDTAFNAIAKARGESS